jgi:hypothetical protein
LGLRSVKLAPGMHLWKECLIGSGPVLECSEMMQLQGEGPGM